MRKLNLALCFVVTLSCFNANAILPGEKRCIQNIMVLFDNVDTLGGNNNIVAKINEIKNELKAVDSLRTKYVDQAIQAINKLIENMKVNSSSSEDLRKVLYEDIEGTQKILNEEVQEIYNDMIELYVNMYNYLKSLIASFSQIKSIGFAEIDAELIKSKVIALDLCLLKIIENKNLLNFHLESIAIETLEIDTIVKETLEIDTL